MSQINELFVFSLLWLQYRKYIVMLCGEMLPVAMDDNVYEVVMKGLAEER